MLLGGGGPPAAVSSSQGAAAAPQPPSGPGSAEWLRPQGEAAAGPGPGLGVPCLLPPWAGRGVGLARDPVGRVQATDPRGPPWESLPQGPAHLPLGPQVPSPPAEALDVLTWSHPCTPASPAWPPAPIAPSEGGDLVSSPQRTLSALSQKLELSPPYPHPHLHHSGQGVGPPSLRVLGKGSASGPSPAPLSSLARGLGWSVSAA